MEWVPIVFIVFKVCVFLTGMFFAIKWHYDQDKKEENKTVAPQSPTELRLFVTTIIVFALSLLGIVYAGCWGNVADGGRGGAIGCALTFFMSLMSLMSKPTAETVLNDHPGQASQEQSNILPEPDPATLIEGLDQLARLKFQTERLRAAFVARLNSAEREKVYLSVASVISTLAWKFGDIAAARLNFRH
jgi:hypothetical protein